MHRSKLDAKYCRSIRSDCMHARSAQVMLVRWLMKWKKDLELAIHHQHPLKYIVIDRKINTSNNSTENQFVRLAILRLGSVHLVMTAVVRLSVSRSVPAQTRLQQQQKQCGLSGEMSCAVPDVLYLIFPFCIRATGCSPACYWGGLCNGGV